MASAENSFFPVELLFVCVNDLIEISVVQVCKVLHSYPPSTYACLQHVYLCSFITCLCVCVCTVLSACVPAAFGHDHAECIFGIMLLKNRQKSDHGFVTLIPILSFFVVNMSCLRPLHGTALP